jgi:hypothetical protein
MPGKIYRYLADDHRRLDALLERAMSDPENIDGAAYAQLRSGLLKHIGMEEKTLLPAAQKLRGGEPLPVAPRLRHDHGALAALLVPTPTRPVMAAIQAILRVHNPIEEDPGVCTISARNWLAPRPIRFCSSCEKRRRSESCPTSMARMLWKRRAGHWRKPATIWKCDLICENRSAAPLFYAGCCASI